MKQHDTTEMLIKYIHGKLTAEESSQVKAALKSDPELADLFQMIQQMENGRRDYDLSVTDAVTKLSSQLFDDFQKQKKRGKTNHGVRIFDSHLLPLPEGVRPAAVDTRRIKYKIGELSLHISLYPVSTESFEMIGQISDDSDIVYEVQLIDKRKTIVAETDRFGLFRFERIPAATYKMVVLSGNKRVGTVDISL